MSAGQQFADETSSIIPQLRQYIDYLMKNFGGMEDIAPKITALSEELFSLENVQLKLADDSPTMRSAVRELTNANAQIATEIKSAKQLQDSVEQAAMIVSIIQGAIKLATAVA